MKSKTSATQKLFKEHKSYTPDEVFAAGGTTVFGLKTQEKKLQALKAIESAPPIEPFTNEEWDDLMNQVANDK